MFCAMLVGMAMRFLLSIVFGILTLCLCSPVCQAQDNYEIQVYGSETVAPKTTMVELHSNYTFQGSKTTVDGVIPTEHELHETVEITQGITLLVRDRLLHLHRGAERPGMAMGRRPHPAASARARELALAGRRQFVHGVRICPAHLLHVSLEPGDKAHR